MAERYHCEIERMIDGMIADGKSEQDILTAICKQYEPYDRFPQFGGVTYRWSGMVMETLDGLGYIGADPTGAENVYLATGDSGMGMTHGTIAGLLLTDLILGRPNPWAELYDPKRLPIRPALTRIAKPTQTANRPRVLPSPV